MKLFRWITGIIGPYALVGIATALSALRDVNPYSFIYFAQLCIKESIAFFLLVFLSCVIIPAPKKYIALASVTLNIAVIISVSVLVSTGADDGYGKPSAITLLTDSASSLVGMAAGVAAVYALFKKKGWGSPKKLTGVSD